MTLRLLTLSLEASSSLSLSVITSPRFFPPGGTTVPRFSPPAGTTLPRFSPPAGTTLPRFSPPAGTTLPRFSPPAGTTLPRFSPPAGTTLPRFSPPAGTTEPRLLFSTSGRAPIFELEPWPRTARGRSTTWISSRLERETPWGAPVCSRISY
jgi:hypothetical protein